MQFYVPTIGDKIFLDKDWTFTLLEEGRNKGLADVLGGLHKEEVTNYAWFEKGTDRVVSYSALPSHYNPDHYEQRETRRWTYKKWNSSLMEVTLPRGTELAIDRIYIRKGNPDYDSITFIVKSTPDKRFKSRKPRFWVKLKDANRISCELEPVHDKTAPAAHRFENLEEL